MSIFVKELLQFHQTFDNKIEALQSISNLFYKFGYVEQPNQFLEVVLAREEVFSTGIGKNIAIPHGRQASIKELKAAVVLLDKELEFESIDDEPVRIIFMIAVPDDQNSTYMKLLSTISGYLRDDLYRNHLLQCDNEEEMLVLLRSIENEISL